MALKILRFMCILMHNFDGGIKYTYSGDRQLSRTVFAPEVD